MSKYSHALHESSSEEFTESQGFNKFLEADNSDEEEAALRRGKNKNQAQSGYGASKGGKAGSYQGGASNYGGGYSNYGGNTGSGLSSGYNTGYSGYGGASTGYGKSYGGGATGYSGASGYGASGYGGGYGDSGYGESGYGAGYSQGGYAGYDMTGFGGSGFDGTGYGGGYKQTGYEAGYNAGSGGGDSYNFKIDLDEIKKRKEQQKEQKLAEQKAEEERKKREEEERKAKENAKNNPGSILKNNPKGGKGGKGKGVSFEPDQDSENENNNSISHITENDDDDDDRRGNKKFSKNKRDQDDDDSSRPTDKILSNLSDSEDKREENKKKLEESNESSIDYDQIELPKPKVFDANMTNKIAPTATKKVEEPAPQKKKDDFKESHDSSYPEDFEGSASHNESSSKFGANNEVTKALNYIQKAKQEDYVDETPNKKDEPRSDLKISPIVKMDDKSKNENLLSINFDNKGSLTNNYENRAAKDYVYESLLKDERDRASNIQKQLSVDSEQLKNIKKLLEEKDLSIKRIEAHNDNLQSDLDVLQTENLELKNENNTYKVENEELVKKIDVLEQKVIEFDSVKKTLERENQEKTRLIKERKEYQEKNIETRITNELKRQYESEKEILLLQIEDLKEENKKFLEEITKLENDLHSQKTVVRGRSDNDSEIRKLKQEVISLQNKLRDRGDEPKVSAADHEKKNEKNPVSGIAYIDKELQMQELMIKGFQKENEKLIGENKSLRKEIENLNERLYDENRKFGDFRTKVVNNTNTVILSEKEVDIETKKLLGSENVISKNEVREAMDKITKLQNEIAGRENTYQARELELKFELDRVRAKNLDLEAKLGGFDLTQLKKQDEEYKKLEQVLSETKKSHEKEVKDLRSKLDWYIENQDSLSGKEQIIKEKDDEIKRLQEEIKRILSDPETNLDSKTNFYNKVIGIEKNRVKKLEKDLTLLEDALKKRNPNLYEKMKSEKEETAVVKELKKTVNQLLSEKEQREADYENRIKDLTQRFDKMNLEFQKRAKEPETKTKQPASNANTEDTEILKKRIKELEKEVQDAKNYYLKKTQETSKRPSTSTAKGMAKDTKALGSTTTSKKVEFAAEERLENKENVVYVNNGLQDHEKANILTRLPNLQNTAIPVIISALNDFKQRSKLAYQKNDKNIAVSSTAQFNKVLSDHIKELSKSIVLKSNQIRDAIIDDGADPTHNLIELQDTINNLIWEEIKKDNSTLLAEVNIQPKVNNFLQVAQTTGGSNNQHDQELAKKSQQLQDLLHDFEKIKSHNVQLMKEKLDLEQIIQRIPKNPTSLDFVTLEKKLEVMERNYRENEIELRNAFKKTYHYDPFGLGDTDVGKIKASYEKEIEQLKAVVLTKNKEISEFRREMEIILRELEHLRNARH